MHLLLFCIVPNFECLRTMWFTDRPLSRPHRVRVRVRMQYASGKDLGQDDFLSLVLDHLIKSNAYILKCVEVVQRASRIFQN